MKTEKKWIVMRNMVYSPLKILEYMIVPGENSPNVAAGLIARRTRFEPEKRERLVKIFKYVTKRTGSRPGKQMLKKK